MSDEQLDVEIDRAVREMMSVDAPGGFRARILSKLEERPRRFGWMTLAGVGTVGAAAAVVLLMMRGPQPIGLPNSTGPAPVSPVASKTPPDVVDPAMKPPAPGSIPGSASGQSGMHVDRLEQQVVAAVAIVEPPSTIAALQEIDPLVVPPVSARDITPAAITIAPLPAIAEVEVKPLSPPDGRD